MKLSEMTEEGFRQREKALRILLGAISYLLSTRDARVSGNKHAPEQILFKALENLN